MRARAEKTANCFLTVFTMLLLSFLTVMAFLFSQRYGMESLGELINGAPIYQIWDDWLVHLGGITVMIVIWLLILHAERKRSWSRFLVPLFQALLSISTGVAAYLVLTGGMRTPQDDQIQIYSAAMLFNRGDYLNLIQGGYVSMYPQQLGMIGYIRLILRLFGTENFYPVQMLNCFWIAGTCFALCLCLDEMTEQRTARVAGSLLFVAQLPLVLLVSWVYGDLPSFCCCALAFLCYLKIIKKSRGDHHLLLCEIALVICLCAAVLFRKNSLIFVIAVMIGLAMHWLGSENRDMRSGIRRFVLIAACILLPEISTIGMKNYYERVSDYELDGGLPTVMWIAMGVSEDASKPGWFGNFSVPAYYSVDCDREAAANLAWERITQRLELFREDPVYCISFYKRKICTQWNDPYYCTQSLIGTDEESAGVTVWLEREQYGTILRMLSAVQFLVYGGALLYTILESKRHHVCDNLCMIYFLGGFLFSLLWEANSRYVFPYVLLLVPNAAIGWDAAFRRIEGLYNGFHASARSHGIFPAGRL